MPTPISTSNIVSQAWRFMELSPISSFDDDTEQARSSAEQYTNALDQCLAVADWSFASVYASLPAADLPPTVATDPDLPYFYQPPGDMIRLHQVGDSDDQIAFRLDRDGLRANRDAPLPIRYTARVTNEARLPATFQTAVALKLAWLLGPRWLGTPQKIAAIERNLQDALQAAKREDARSASSVRYDLQPDTYDWATANTL